MLRGYLGKLETSIWATDNLPFHYTPSPSHPTGPRGIVYFFYKKNGFQIDNFWRPANNVDTRNWTSVFFFCCYWSRISIAFIKTKIYAIFPPFSPPYTTTEFPTHSIKLLNLCTSTENFFKASVLLNLLSGLPSSSLVKLFNPWRRSEEICMRYGDDENQTMLLINN